MEKVTELILLDRVIGANYKTVKEFCKAIEMTPQNLNYLKRKAKENNGMLDQDFKRRLKSYDIDLYQYERKPTNDFVNAQPQANLAAEPEGIYIQKERLLVMMETQLNIIQSQQGTISSQQHTIDKLTDPPNNFKKTG
jgi:prefoldin subunit 5